MLLLDAFNLRHVLHLVAELANVNLLDGDGFNGRADPSFVRVLRSVSGCSERFLVRG